MTAQWLVDSPQRSAPLVEWQAFRAELAKYPHDDELIQRSIENADRIIGLKLAGADRADAVFEDEEEEAFYAGLSSK